MNSNPTFTMLIGLPGSGKSTYAEQLSHDTNATILSSDKIRKELYGDESVQADNEKVFQLMQKRSKECLMRGEDVIYDATNLSSKYRAGLLREFSNIPCHKQCIVVATPYRDCLSRNHQRGRIVPDDVIERMYKQWKTPHINEGWDEISLKHTAHDRRSIFEWLFEHRFYDQQNSYHSQTLGVHMAATYSLVSSLDIPALESSRYATALPYAALLHDCGKPFCKSHTNKRGEPDGNAHYYSHANTGAYDALFFEYPANVNPLDVSVLINLHMEPFGFTDVFTKRRMAQWGPDLFQSVMVLHSADKDSHDLPVQFDKILESLNKERDQNELQLD